MAFDPVTAAFEVGGKLLDRILPDKDKRDKAKLALFELKQNGELAKLASTTDLAKGQQAINTIEAGHKSLFVAGWRPSIGWTCSLAFLYHFVLQPVLVFALTVAGQTITVPTFDMQSLLTVMLGMLGLGGLRTIEKIKKIS